MLAHVLVRSTYGVHVPESYTNYVAYMQNHELGEMKNFDRTTALHRSFSLQTHTRVSACQKHIRQKHSRRKTRFECGECFSVFMRQDSLTM